MEYKINSMKKELALKDKQIKILREKNCLHNLAYPSDESSNNADIVEDLNNSYLNFEEEFNVTNNSNESNGPVKYFILYLVIRIISNIALQRKRIFLLKISFRELKGLYIRILTPLC
jgi:hypothetical protein